MNLFLSLFTKLIPLYFLILLGYIAGKKLNAKKETIASILIYVVAPIVIFNSIVSTKITVEIMVLPLVFFLACCFISINFYFIGKRFFKDSTKNLLALCAGTANTGYFGIPVAIGLLGEQAIGLMIIGIIGFTAFENSLGFFIAANGNYTAKEALLKLLKLPTIYAFILGVVFNILGFNSVGEYATFSRNFIGAYTILGMMLVGLGLSDMRRFGFDLKFLLLTFLAKFIVWPLTILLLVYIDNTSLNLFNDLVHKVMILLSIVPLAANAVAFSSELKIHPEKAALAVFISTLIALFYIPFVVMIIF